MYRKKINRKIIFVLLIMVLIEFGLYAVNNRNNNNNFKYKCEVVVSENVLKRIKDITPNDHIRDYKKIKKLIEHYIKKAFNEAITKLKGNLDNIQNMDSDISAEDTKKALSELLKGIETYTNTGGKKGIKVTIKYDVDEKFYTYFVKEVDKDEKEHIVKKHCMLTINNFLDPDQIIKNNKSNNNNNTNSNNNEYCNSDILIGFTNAHAETDGNFDITMFNAYLDCVDELFEIEDPNRNGCKYKTLAYFPAKITAPAPNLRDWTLIGVKDSKIGSEILHELTHNALHHFGNRGQKRDRWGDEATVDDIVAKIYRRADSLNYYEYSYYYQLFYYRAYKVLGREEYVKRRYLLRDARFDYYVTDKFNERRYNPPSILIYGFLNPMNRYYTNAYAVVDEIGYYEFNYKDDTFADDVRDEELKNYVIPYRICCKNGNNNRASTCASRDSSTSESGEKCDPEKPNGGGSGHPGGDRPDDNFSFSDGKPLIYDLSPESVVYVSGYWVDTLRLTGGLFWTGNNGAEELKKITPFLIFPTGSLFSHQNDTALKETLKQYVKEGGTIVVFAQQYGKQVENIIPVPDGEKLKVYGWREDQSCYWGSVYGSIKHPALSSLTYDRASAAVDCSFQSLSCPEIG